MSNDTQARAVLEISGSARETFLNALVTNSVTGKSDSLIYTALLTPQGKYLFDFFLALQGERILVDVASERADELKTRLEFYKLRADVNIEQTDYHIALSHSAPKNPKEGAFAYRDPRYPALGWRIYSKTTPPDGGLDLTAERVEHVIPEYKSELIANETYILEAGFERLNGVDFEKGCFIGQEIVARMKHKTTLRKGFCRVRMGEDVAFGTPLLSQGKEIGRICSTHKKRAIAYLHYERAKGQITANNVEIEIDWRPV